MARADADPGERPDPTRVVGRRFAQGTLDKALVVVVALVVTIAVAVPLVMAAHGLGARGVAMAVAAVYCVTLLLAAPLNEVWLARRWGGATVGMRLLGLRVVTADGTPPATRAYVFRWLLWVADGLCLGLVGLGVMLCSRYHQRFGDIVAETFVVRASSVVRTAQGEPAGADAGAGAATGSIDGSATGAAAAKPSPWPTPAHWDTEAEAGTDADAVADTDARGGRVS